MSMKNKTWQLDSLRDELEFYDIADDNNDQFINNTWVYDDIQVSDDLEDIQERFKDREIDIQREEFNIEGPPLERKNTGKSSDIENYMLCQNWMKEKGQLFDREKSEEMKSTASAKSETEDKNLAYLKDRNPMKEFFVLTAQAVKLNSPYMETILNLHINEMYEQVLNSSTPFYKWSGWIEDYLHRTILSKIYSEAFLKQNLKKIKDNPRENSQNLQLKESKTQKSK